jgi:hypothetical protein
MQGLGNDALNGLHSMLRLRTTTMTRHRKEH